MFRVSSQKGFQKLKKYSTISTLEDASVCPNGPSVLFLRDFPRDYWLLGYIIFEGAHQALSVRKTMADVCSIAVILIRTKYRAYDHVVIPTNMRN